MPLSLALILGTAYLLYFINDSVIKYISQDYKAESLIRARGIFTLLFCLLWLILSREWQHLPDFHTLQAIFLISILNGSGLYFFIKANQNANFQNVIAINLTGLVIQQIIANFFLHEPVDKDIYVSLVIICTGFFILLQGSMKKTGLFYAILSSLFWSTGYALLSIPLKNTTPVWGTFLTELFILVTFMFLGVTKAGFSINKSLQIKNIFIPIIGLTATVGAYLFNYAYTNFLVSEISLIATMFFPLSFLSGRLVFKENITRWEWVGNIFILIGILNFLLN